MAVASDCPGVDTGVRGPREGEWSKRVERREGEGPVRWRCSPARVPGQSEVPVGLPLLPPRSSRLQVRVKDRRSSWVRNIQSRGEVRHTADQVLSSQSPNSLSFFRGKTESQGPFVWPRLWSNAHVFPAWLSYLRSQLGIAGNFLS